MPSSRALIFTAILAAAPIAHSASPAKKKDAPANIAAPASKFSEVPFPFEAENLPANYIGHNCREIAAKLKAVSAPKGEFEKTADFAKRMDSVTTTPIGAKLTATDQIAFAARPFTLEKNYNADTEELEVNIAPIQTVYFDGGRDVRASILDQRTVKNDTYIGSNSFGKSVTVERSVIDVCVVAFANKPSSWGGTRKWISVPLKDAQALKENIGVLYVGAPSAPYHARYVFATKPKIDNPREMFASGDTVVINLAEAWIYDTRSGKVYAKLNLADGSR